MAFLQVQDIKVILAYQSLNFKLLGHSEFSLTLTIKIAYVDWNIVTASIVWLLCQTRPDQTRPDQSRPDQTRPDQTRPDQIKLDKTRLEETIPNQKCRKKYCKNFLLK